MDRRDLVRAAAAIASADVIALCCHVSPDGDALGSMLALHHTLLAAGRNSVASFAGPHGGRRPLPGDPRPGVAGPRPRPSRRNPT